MADTPAKPGFPGQEPGEEASQNVIVALKLRPLVASEVEQGSRECLAVTPGLPQVGTGQHTFTYDHVFGGNGGSDPGKLYTTCVAPLVDGLFKGYNATVFAYGQTGSGKTYTMGSEYRPGGQRMVTGGVIPEAISALFSRMAAAKDWQCSLRVSFVEIHKEEVRDLLVTTAGPRPAVSIREVLGGGVCLYGAVEREVKCPEEMWGVLEMGTLCRATASTSMNSRSSRSHAIFTITLEQRRTVASAPAPGSAAGRTVDGDEEDDEGEGDEGGDGEAGMVIDDYLCAKMHLVDLAGSERAKRTKAEGARLKEGIHINRGLLALGNVINAIVDGHKHIPYRDSKLTRLLQDSLGGNSRTVMIACVSPADVNFEESLNTLRYADRARHIRNKPTVNRDPVAAQVAFLRQQIAALRGENIALKAALAADGKSLEDISSGEAPGGTHWAVVEQLQAENTNLELDNTRVKLQLEEVTHELEVTKDKLHLLQATLDRTTTELQLLRGETPTLTGAVGTSSAGGAPITVDNPHGKDPAAHAHDLVVASYVARVAELEKELRAMKQFTSLRRRAPSLSKRPSTVGGEAPPGTPDAPPRTPGSGGGAGLGSSGSALGTPGTGGYGDGLPTTAEEAEEEDGPGPGHDGGHEEEGDEELYYAEMAAHALEQEKMKAELVALQRLLESKERRMAELTTGTGEVPALKQHYDRVLVALQSERDSLMAEKISIMQKLQHLQAASEEERKRLEAGYREKLANYDDKLRTLRHKEREFIAMQKLKQRTEDMCRRLSNDISRIKQQKVALQKNMETSAKQFAVWRHEREKELVQLRKQARRSAAHIQALEAMQAKQNAVLQRKIADANAARKKLRELQTSAHASAAAVVAAARDGGVSAGERASHSAFRSSADFGGAGGLASAASGGLLDMQPNPGAPLLRTEKARREWLEKELDLCNQSYEYRRVLEGELAQRADVNRQLRNVMKRLMMVNNLVPASPLAAGPSGCPTPGPSQLGDAVVSQLLDRKTHLERQLAEHNTQITELQAAWERAKAEEESRGGGAADVRRWMGIRTVVEARELLKNLFRLASDHKANAADGALEGLKLMEELDLLRVQLDAARKEAEAQRMRAAAIEATAATAMATPMQGGHHRHSMGPAGSGLPRLADETDQEVDDLLAQLHRAKTPTRFGEDEGVQLGSPASSVDEPAALAPSSTASRGGDITRAAAEPAGPRNGRAGGGAGGRGGGQRGGRAAAVVNEEEDSSEESVDEGDDVGDVDWDPQLATPAPATRGEGLGRRRSSRVAPEPTAAGLGSSSSGVRAPSEAPVPRGGRRKSSSVAPTPPVDSTTAATLGKAGHVSDPWLEASVLADVNRGRSSRGLPPAERLTVQLMKDSLRDRTLPDGKPWRAGSKTRDQLLCDYALILGLHGGTGAATPGTGELLDITNATTNVLFGTSPSPEASYLLRELSPVRPPSARSSPASPAHARRPVVSARGQGGSPPTRIPHVHSSPRLTSPRPVTAGGYSPQPQRRATYVADMVQSDSPLRSLARGAVFSAGGAMGSQYAAAHSPRMGDAGDGLSPHAGSMTPMSLLYIQKAQEARKRMADMRSSLPRALSASAAAGGESTGGGGPLPAAHALGHDGAQVGVRQSGGVLSPRRNSASNAAPVSAGVSGGSTPRLVSDPRGPKAVPSEPGLAQQQQQSLAAGGQRSTSSPLSSGRRVNIWK